ncbi:unnamed protein product [Ilex paraguariensis]|uniref:Uncharacterized protein n=1 Tax=Ilex paraguariensis TaxID=185542 RepID=A0ABC8R4R8_9AQUA
MQVIIREEGILGLWSGAAPTVLRNGINQAAMFTAKNFFDGVLWGKREGTVGPCCKSPFDAVKMRLMALSRSVGELKYRGMFHAIATIYMEEGLLALWKGTAAPANENPTWPGDHVGCG